jgi:hypothetical protein
MKTRMFLFAALIAVILVGGFSHAAFAKGGSGGGGGGATKVKIVLSPSAAYPKAKGSASYKVKGSKREFEAEAEHLNKLAGQTLGIFVNGTQVASATVDGLRHAKAELSTELGNTVPNIQTGDLIEVKDSAGVVVVSGNF